MGYFTSLYASELPHRAVAVYMYLKDRAGRDGKCYPAIGTIAAELVKLVGREVATPAEAREIIGLTKKVQF